MTDDLDIIFRLLCEATEDLQRLNTELDAMLRRMDRSCTSGDCSGMPEDLNVVALSGALLLSQISWRIDRIKNELN